MTADPVGGVWSFALELCRALEPLDVEVALATMGAPLDTAQRAAACALPNVTVHESPFRVEWMEDPWDDVAAAGEWLLELAAALRPDVVHLNGYAHAALPWQRPVVVTAHSCVLSWWRAVHAAPAPPVWTRYASSVRQGLQAADLVAAPTRAMLQSCMQNYGVLNRTVVIPNGVSQAVATSRPRRPFVLAAGRAWDAAKNVASLDAAADAIVWPVCVAGAAQSPDGADVDFRGVTLLGALEREEMHATYASAPIFAHPSLYEPFGLAPLEAALHGCALVLGDIPSLREVWGENAVFVAPRDATGLADAINELISEDIRRERLAARAQQHARSYTATRMAQGYYAAFHALTGARPRREVTACV